VLDLLNTHGHVPLTFLRVATTLRLSKLLIKLSGNQHGYVCTCDRASTAALVGGQVATRNGDI
jgi:hypothetical protein